MAETIRMGKRGTLVIPASLRRRFGLEEGSLLLIEEGEEGLLMRPAVALPVELYGPRRRAELLLSNAVDEKEYEQARAQVREMGMDPDEIAHTRPEEG